MRSMYEVLALDLPDAYRAGCKVAAQTAGTVAEAMLLAALTSKKLSKAEQEKSLKGTLDQVEKHSTAFAQDVKSSVHHAILTAATQKLLGS